MLASITQLFRPAEVETDPVREEWERLLAAATTAQERDEINDAFGRIAA